MSGKAERIAQTFNGKAQWIVAGGYFKLLETVNPVTVELYRGGNRVMYAAAAEGGFYHRAQFDRVEITTSGAEAVAWFYGPEEGGQDRFSGSVTVTGDVDVSDRAARLLGIVYGNLGQLAQALIGGVNAAQVTERGFTYGAAFSSTTGLSANTNETIIAPGSNTNGLILWAGEGVTGNGGGSTALGALLAKASAPGSMIDGDVLAILKTDILLSGASVRGFWRLPRPVFVASGKGIYYRTDVAEGVTHRTLLYTVL